MYVVATDKGMSGWGGVARSLVAVECLTSDDLDAAKAWLEARPEMTRVRVNLSLPRVKQGDNLKVWNRADHPIGMFGVNNNA